MGCVQRAVLEFDEEVRVPWRPRLVSDDEPAESPLTLAGRSSAARPGSSRVGVCRPPSGGDRSAGTAPAARRSVPGGRRPAPSSAPRSASPGSGSGVAGRSRSPRVRFTRRARRLAVLLALSGGVVVGAWLGQSFSAGGDRGLRLVGASSVAVESGDTLWSIAASVAEGEDVRAVVDRLQRRNGLSGADLVPGQVLHLP